MNFIRPEATLDIRSNMVGGNLQVFKNTGPGAKTVEDNTVRESLQCFDNDPPFEGTANTAGQAQGQCMPLP